MKQGIIMEVNDRFLTLLTPEGEFLNARNLNRNYQIGQEISFVPVKKESFLNGWSKGFYKKTAVVLVAASLLLVFTFIPRGADNEVYAYMSIDGESSIELAVNKDLEVIDVIAYNESGKEIIADIDWENVQVDKVSSEILSSIDSQDLYSESQGIVVGTVYAGSQEEKIDEKLYQVIDTLKEQSEVEIENVQATAKERKEAKEYGVSVGKYKAEQAKEKAKDKKEVNVNEDDTPVETPAPRVTIPDNNSTNTPAVNNNGKANANPNAQKDNSSNQHESGNGNSNESNPGQQKNDVKKTEKQSNQAVIKQEIKNKQVQGNNKEEKPRK